MLRSCIVSLNSGTESMESSDRKPPLPRNMPGRIVASCQVELEEAGADYSFWHMFCYVFELPPCLESVKSKFPITK